MGTFVYDQDAMNLLTEKKTTNFKEAIEKAKAEGRSFIVKHSINKAGKLVKTILGWDMYIISYQMAKKLFDDNVELSAKLAEMHENRLSKSDNEVYAWSPADKLLLEMHDINFQRILV